MCILHCINSKNRHRYIDNQQRKLNMKKIKITEEQKLIIEKNLYTKTLEELSNMIGLNIHKIKRVRKVFFDNFVLPDGFVQIPCCDSSVRTQNVLSEEEVSIIRELYSSGCKPKFIWEKFSNKISRTSIYDIVKRRTWKHI